MAIVRVFDSFTIVWSNIISINFVCECDMIMIWFFHNVQPMMCDMRRGCLTIERLYYSVLLLSLPVYVYRFAWLILFRIHTLKRSHWNSPQLFNPLIAGSLAFPIVFLPLLAIIELPLTFVNCPPSFYIIFRMIGNILGEEFGSLKQDCQSLIAKIVAYQNYTSAVVQPQCLVVGMIGHWGVEKYPTVLVRPFLTANLCTLFRNVVMALPSCSSSSHITNIWFGDR